MFFLSYSLMAVKSSKHEEKSKVRIAGTFFLKKISFEHPVMSMSYEPGYECLSYRADIGRI